MLKSRSAQERCPVHNVRLLCFCPACRGSVRTKRKAAASRRNGKLGGRPPMKGAKQ